MTLYHIYRLTQLITQIRFSKSLLIAAPQPHPLEWLQGLQYSVCDLISHNYIVFLNSSLKSLVKVVAPSCPTLEWLQGLQYSVYSSPQFMAKTFKNICQQWIKNGFYPKCAHELDIFFSLTSCTVLGTMKSGLKLLMTYKWLTNIGHPLVARWGVCCMLWAYKRHCSFNLHTTEVNWW